MTEKLTPEEIKKALGCCAGESPNCSDCPANRYEAGKCFDIVKVQAVSVMNSQQETIKTLRKCVEQHHIIRKDGKSPLSLLTAEIRAEAIKEFAERLKEHLKGNGGLYCVTTMNAKIDILVKEMVGEDE